MEAGQPEDAKSSSEETEKKEQVVDDAGTARFYECVFCKRGFTTAQALGGHMNIHRRDRAKNKQQPTNPSVSNQPMEDFTRSGVLHPLPGHTQFYSPSMEMQRNSPTYFPSSESSTANKYAYLSPELQSQKPLSLSLFAENPQTNLSLQIGGKSIEDKQKEGRQTEEEDELDLTLRLGHDP